ncbi:hypothetical protein BDR07DRAFT_1371323 [Suillus spraguei]|nr:hypothetical protein BDR07DRAFT_1371323 [Suillus spraguei]
MDPDYEPEDNEGVDTTVLNGCPLHSDNSGLGDNGRPVVFSAGKFWNFINISLENVLKEWQVIYQLACKGVVEYFQQDLTGFPGNMVIPKLLTSNTPQWQTTIQNTLLWNED